MSCEKGGKGSYKENEERIQRPVNLIRYQQKTGNLAEEIDGEAFRTGENH